jgi:hypothetical protein
VLQELLGKQRYRRRYNIKSFMGKDCKVEGIKAL